MSEDVQSQLIWGTVVAIVVIALSVLAILGINSNRNFWLACVENGNQYLNGACVRVAGTLPSTTAPGK